MIVTLILVAIPVLVIFGLIAIYNRLVRNRNLAEEGWSGVDVQLKRRSDLIPNLIETVQGYMKYEKDLLSKVTELRSKSLTVQNMGEKGKLENALSRSLANLFAVAENYPDLKANQNFLDLQKQLADIENEIQMARRYYNGTARNLNILIESFPSSIVAGMFHFTKKDYFEIDESEKAIPKVAF
ncbi:LemA family protein [bacterium]|nr:LemA family protein [bacterium]